MRDLVEFVARALCEDPEAVKVEVREGPIEVYALSVGPNDLGKVIGRQGRTAKALRTLLAARAELLGRKVGLEILD